MASTLQCGISLAAQRSVLLTLLIIISVNIVFYSVYIRGLSRQAVEEKEIRNDANLISKSNASFCFINDRKEDLNSVIRESNQRVTDDGDKEDFDIVIKESNKCFKDDGGEKDVFLVIVVTTAPANFAYRQAIRKTWGSISDVNGTRVTVMFMLGQCNITNRTLDEDIYDESVKFHDIVRDNFTDTYANLTLKTIACLKWATLFCPHASYVMKADDNTFINIHRFVAHLRDESTPKVNFAEGWRIVNSKPIRDTRNKWHILRSDFNKTVFPPYLSGHGYVMSRDVAAKTFLASQSITPIRLEDVYFGLCLHAAGINQTHSNRYYLDSRRLKYCKPRKSVYTWHPTNPIQMYNLWNIEIGKEPCRV